MKYKALLWDNDGTIADTKDWILSSFDHCMKEVLDDPNPDKTAFNKTMGQTLHDQLTHYTDDKALIEKIMVSYRTHNEKVLEEMIKTFDGLPQALKQLTDAGYFCGVVTSKVHNLTERGLVALDLRQYFSYIQGCDDCPVFKPNPGVLTHACNYLELDPKDVLYIGDTIFDMKAASGAGCDTCAVLWGIGTKEILEQTNPTYIVEKPADLIDILL